LRGASLELFQEFDCSRCLPVAERLIISISMRLKKCDRYRIMAQYRGNFSQTS
jgi:hypothetical protein